MFWKYPIENLKDLTGLIADIISIFGITIGGGIIFKKLIIIIKPITNNYYINKDTDISNNQIDNSVSGIQVTRSKFVNIIINK